MDDGMLPRIDPKIALARANFSGAIDLNEASFKKETHTEPVGISIAYLVVHPPKEEGEEKQYELKVQKIKDSELRTMDFTNGEMPPRIKYKSEVIDIVEDTFPSENIRYRLLADKLLNIPSVHKDK